MNFHSALNVIRDMVKARPGRDRSSTKAPTRWTSRARIVDMYEPRKRLDVGTWGIMGIGMGFAVAAAVDHRQAGDRDRRRQRLRLLAAWRSKRSAATTCRCASIVFNNNGVYKGTDVNPRGGDVAPTRVRQGRALRHDDAGLRRRRRATRPRPAELSKALDEAIASRQADADQRHHRRDRRHRERPHHQPEPATAAKKK